MGDAQTSSYSGASASNFTTGPISTSSYLYALFKTMSFELDTILSSEKSRSFGYRISVDGGGLIFPPVYISFGRSGSSFYLLLVFKFILKILNLKIHVI